MAKKHQSGHKHKFPIIGFIVGVVAPVTRAMNQAGMTLTNLGDFTKLQAFANTLAEQYTGVNPGYPGQFFGQTLATTYVPIGVYVIVKKVFGRTLGQIFQGLPVSF